MMLDKFIMSIIIVSMLAVTIGGVYVSFATTYDVPVDQKYQATFNKFNESYAISEDISKDIKGAAIEKGETSDWDIGQTVIASLNAVKVVFVQGIPTALGMVTNLGEFIPLNPIIINTIQALILVSVAFALVYLYFRYKNE